jgi:hypothetical protein
MRLRNSSNVSSTQVFEQPFRKTPDDDVGAEDVRRYDSLQRAKVSQIASAVRRGDRSLEEGIEAFVRLFVSVEPELIAGVLANHDTFRARFDRLFRRLG